MLAVEIDWMLKTNIRPRHDGELRLSSARANLLYSPGRNSRDDLRSRGKFAPDSPPAPRNASRKYVPALPVIEGHRDGITVENSTRHQRRGLSRRAMIRETIVATIRGISETPK